MHHTLINNPIRSSLAKVLWLMGSILLAPGLKPQALAADADGEVIEEVVVTGSYLKRIAADSPSPLSVIGAAQIEDLLCCRNTRSRVSGTPYC